MARTVGLRNPAERNGRCTVRRKRPARQRETERRNRENGMQEMSALSGAGSSCSMKAETDWREDETPENRHKKEAKVIKFFLHFLRKLL